MPMVSGVHAGAMIQQEAYRVRIPGGCGAHQRRVAISVSVACARSGGNQQFNNLRVAASSPKDQCSATRFICCARIRLGVQERFNHVGQTSFGSVHQSRAIPDVMPLDVNSLTQNCSNRLSVTVVRHARQNSCEDLATGASIGQFGQEGGECLDGPHRPLVRVGILQDGVLNNPQRRRDLDPIIDDRLLCVADPNGGQSLTDIRGADGIIIPKREIVGASECLKELVEFVRRYASLVLALDCDIREAIVLNQSVSADAQAERAVSVLDNNCRSVRDGGEREGWRSRC